MNVGSIDALRARAATDPAAAIREASKQFEALFMQELMKSMRQAQQSMSSGMFDDAGSRMGTEMLDTELATKMTGLPGGLAEAIARQLERQTGGRPETPLAPVRIPDATRVPPDGSVSRHQADFVTAHADAARAVESATGIPAAFTIAQAAHESGWGRREIRHADGTPSFNLFGIKAGAGWTGKVAEVTTTEYVDGVARKTVARFRAYGSHAESFADYARLMKASPRYRPVLQDAATPEGFAQGLQRAGYATDPAYADKLTRVINTTLRLARGVA